MDISFFQFSLLVQGVIVYLLLINTIAFIMFGVDKIQAQRGNSRTPEKVLWFLSLLGGTLGALFGMKLFRHKTKKISFQIVLLLIFMLQMGLIILLFRQMM